MREKNRMASASWLNMRSAPAPLSLVMMASCLPRSARDIVTASDVGGIANLPKPDRRMLEIAEKIIAQHEGKFDPSTFNDRYEDAVRDLIARKKRGQKVTTAPPVEKDDGKVVNLMDALRRSLAGQSSGSKERFERFVEHKKGKVVPKAKPKTKKSVA
jgi:DNA end-binding protein Ku